MAKRSPYQVDTIARGLDHPWAVALLPAGDFLVTERPGTLRRVSVGGGISDPLSGVPEVVAEDQGGLLDLVLAPDFETSRTLYLTYSEPGPRRRSGTTAARARLAPDGASLDDLTVIFRQEPKAEEGYHFGSRIVFRADGTLFITTGERFLFDPAQDLATHLGKIIRIRPDGTTPPDNPFVGVAGAKPEIWSYGHRNVQAAAIRPETGDLWIAEMGPAGGDELNRPEPGKNYGWPLVSWGRHYDGKRIPLPTTRPDLEDCIHHWTPVISPSGMCFYRGGLFPGWRGSVLIGSLSDDCVVRVTLRGNEYESEERIAIGARVRDVREASDGSVYVVTDEDDGALLRITPAA